MLTGVDWQLATRECVGFLRELLRIPSVNPPGLEPGSAGRDSRTGETDAARYCAEVLTGAGIDAEVIESVPGRGSCLARLRAPGPDALPPLVLLSHVDVVPVEEERWTRDPFGGELVDGDVWGRGAVDMKDMVAMELAVMLALQRSAVELRRDVIFAALADEEAGGTFGARYLVERHADRFASAAGMAAVALNEVGGYSIALDGRRFYTIQVAEKGIIWTRLRVTGEPGHGSMPHAGNAALRLSDAVVRVAGSPRAARPIPVVAGFLRALGLGAVADLVARDPGAATAVLEAAVPDRALRRSIVSMLRDTVSPNVLRAGTKVNVIPGLAEAELDVRTLPGTDQDELLADLQALAGDGVEVSAVRALPAVEAPADAEIVQLMREALLRADPDGIPVPMMITPGTDAKSLVRLGIPTYGFAPLRLAPEVPFLSLFHGDDERVPVSALEFGLPVLAEVVTRFAART